MLLSGVGDALGYRNQLWEYNESGPAIHQVSPGPTWKEKSNTAKLVWEPFFLRGRGLRKGFQGGH